AKLRDRMRFELKDVQRRFNQTIIYVTHDQDEAMAVSDRIVLMNKGTIQQTAPPREIYHRPGNLFSARFIGRSNFVAGAISDTVAGTCVIELSGKDASISVDPANNVPLRAGDEVEAVIRYQDVKVSTTKTDNTVYGTVVASTYLGGAVLYEFETSAGFLFAETDDAIDLPYGTEVYLQLSSVHVFPLASPVTGSE
nr:TOBE domain-containing protein [Spirochaeta sp.]